MARNRPRARGLYHRIVLGLERRVFARTPQIVAISDAGRREIGSLYGVTAERLTVVYNGVDLERFHPRNRVTHRAGARAEAGVPPDAWAVLFVGSGFERKGLGTAIEAFAALPDRESRLLILGKGDTRTYRAMAARAGIGPRVAWLGARPDPERWYAAADLVTLPSRYEPFGNVHLEALASGLPVVASARAGGAEVIADGLNGAVVDPTDASAVAAALARFREGSTRDVGEAARRSAEPFTYRAQVSALQRVYERMSPARCDFP